MPEAQRNAIGRGLQIAALFFASLWIVVTFADAPAAIRITAASATLISFATGIMLRAWKD